MGVILEVKALDEANKLIEKENYRLERYSETRDCYILVKRVR
jgi:hypothetical protein